MKNNRFTSVVYLVYICIILIGGFLFPIRLHIESMLDIVSLAICVFGITIFFRYFSNEKAIKIFIKLFFLNILGIIFRIILEFGEYSLYTSLTFVNIFTYIIVLPVTVSLLYYTIRKYE